MSTDPLVTALRELGGFTAGLDWPAVPGPVRHALSRVLFDSVVVTIAGGRLPEARRLRRALPYGGGPATVFGSPGPAGVIDAAWLNGVSMVSLEMDEGNKRARGHPAAHVLPAALAVAEARRATGADLAVALLAGHEVASRFGQAVHPHPGVHPHGNWGVTGAAAAAARLTGLDGAATARAIDAACALALATPFRVATAGLPVRDAWIGHANAAGIQAAALAAAGTPGTGPGPADRVPVVGVAADSLGGLLGALPRPEELTGALGTGFAVTGGYFKRHASCSYTHPPADAALEVYAGRGPVGPADVSAVRVATHRLAAPLRGRDWPTRMAAMFSIPYVVAVALRAGACGVEQFGPRYRTDPDVRALAGLVEVVEDGAMTARLPDHRAAELLVTWADGTSSRLAVSNPVGDADHRPLSDADLSAKAAALLGDHVQADRVRDLCRDLLDCPDVSATMRLLRAEAVGGGTVVARRRP